MPRSVDPDRGGPEVAGAEVDGVPTFWCEAPGAYCGALVFRVGRADETLRTGGITHLVEHLALHRLAPFGHEAGGFVDDTRTVFHARGTREEVASFLAGVCRQLGALPADRVGDERRVLRAEGEGAGGTHPLWGLRFGPAGYGLLCYPEYGLHWLEGDAIQAWAGSRFTRSNAALWFSGEPPADLDLRLTEGNRIAPPRPRGLPGLELPAWAPSQDTGTSISLLVPRSTAMNATTTILVERLQDHLRGELGLSYSVGGSYWRLDSAWAHVIVGADGAPGHGRAVRDGVLRVVDALATSGPTAEQLERYVTLSERYLDDPEAVPTLLDAHASDELAGAHTPSPAEILAEHRELTPERIAAGLGEAVRGMVIQVPAGLSVAGATRRRPRGLSQPIDGVEYGPGGNGDDSVTVGELGVSQRIGADTTTIRYRDCALVALEGGYAATLIGRCGESIWFRYHGEAAREQILGAITAGVPEELIVHVDDEIAERLDLAMELAERQLGTRAGWALTALPGLLFEGEELLNLARAKLGGEAGLLALTDARLLFIDEPGRRLLAELPRQIVAHARSQRGLRRGKLVVEADDGERVFSAVSPGARAVELAVELGRGAAAGSKPPVDR